MVVTTYYILLLLLNVVVVGKGLANRKGLPSITMKELVLWCRKELKWPQQPQQRIFSSLGILLPRLAAASRRTLARSPTFLRYLFLRLAMAVLSRTYHVPDETWQSAEVAHGLVFGNGYLTWEWKSGIRSYLHPLLFVPPLHLLKITGMDSHVFLVVLLPRVTQAVVSAIGDTLIHAFCARHFGPKTARWFGIAYSTNAFINYCSSR